MKAQFTKAEKEILRGQSAKLAKKHGCSKTYIQLIINGSRNTDSEKAQAILNDLKELIKLLK